MVGARSGCADTHNRDENSDDNADHHQNNSDDTENFTNLGERFSFRVHGARRDLLEIRVSHDPCCNANGLADDQAEDSENENECAAMWFHRFAVFLSGDRNNERYFFGENDYLPRYEHLAAGVSWIVISLSSGRAGVSLFQIQAHMSSMVGFSSPGMSLR